MSKTAIKNFHAVSLKPDTKGVFLDFDNCLYVYEPCHRSALMSAKNEMEKIIGKSHDFFALYTTAQDRVKRRIPKAAASHSRLLYFEAMFELLGMGSMIEKSLFLENVYWKKFMEKMKLVSGVKKFLIDCKKKNIKIVIVSDLTAGIQFEKMMKLGMDHLVDFVVTSEEAGAEKPHKKIFQLALKKAGLKSHEVIMIGDSLQKDVQGAQVLGIKALQIIHE
ncbi:MAG: HAD family hydrolase [Candidatus Pacebacteria bacterium]|jgi:putative hydrolase of the HAD superfamily|nr:HAD family hydrolase [Candidatus Paceibacterota bacterium]